MFQTHYLHCYHIAKSWHFLESHILNKSFQQNSDQSSVVTLNQQIFKFLSYRKNIQLWFVPHVTHGFAAIPLVSSSVSLAVRGLQMYTDWLRMVSIWKQRLIIKSCTESLKGFEMKPFWVFSDGPRDKNFRGFRYK